MGFARDSNNATANIIRPGPTIQNLTFGPSSVASAPISDGVRVVRLAATASCRYRLGEPATASSILLPAGVVEYIGVTPGDVIHVIQVSSGGDLSIVECP
jgi:Fe2+ transport system protein FeoA